MITTEGIKDALTKDVRNSILEKPNVWAVGVGLRYENGVEQKEPGITVRVKNKVSESELNIDERVPQSLKNIPVDIVEAEEPQREDFTSNGHGLTRTDLRPAPGGASLVNPESGGIGTAAGVYDDDTGNRVILTVDHLIGSSGDPVDQYSTQIGTVQETHPGYDTSLVDVTTESDATSAILGLAEIGSPEDPVAGEWYLVCGDRTGWHGERCTGSDLYFSDMDGRGVEYRRIGYTSGDGNSGAGYMRYDPDTNTLHPVSLHYAGNADYSYSMMMSSVQEATGTLTPTSNTTQPSGDPSANAYFDAAINDVRYDDLNREFVVDFILGNLGGGNTTSDTVQLLDASSNVVDSLSYTATSLEFSHETLRIPESRAGEDLTLETRDNDQNVVPLSSDIAQYDVKGINFPQYLEREDIKTVVYYIENTGDVDSSAVQVTLELDGSVVRSDNIAIDSGEQKKRPYIVDAGELTVGTHTLTVTTPDDTASVDFNVKSNPVYTGYNGAFGNFGMGQDVYGATEFSGTSVNITSTNSPVNEGNILDVNVDIENASDSEVTDDIELRIL